MARKAAKTGPGPTVMVALEQEFPEKTRIINDDLALKILPAGTRAGIWIKLRLMPVVKMLRWSEEKMPGMWSGFMCRKRYIDEQLSDITQDRAGAVVNLGAGFDTRAYRLNSLAEIPVWEVDQPDIIAAKQKRLLKLFGKIPEHVTLVPVDFENESLDEILAAYDFPANMRTFFIWEAVTQYLPETSVRDTFDFLAKAKTGSRLIFTYVRKDFIDGKNLYGHNYMYNQMVARGVWLFGLEPENLSDLLEPCGWKVLEHLGYDELAERYVKPTGRELLSTPLERIVYAEKS